MNFNDIFESMKKSDVKATERKMEKNVVDMLDNNEINFLNQFLTKGEMIDGKKFKSIDAIIAKYKKTIGGTKVKSDPNLSMIAPILASMISTIEKKS
jgi:hypothetical protein